MTVERKLSAAGSAAGVAPAMSHICRTHPYTDSGDCAPGCVTLCGQTFGSKPGLVAQVDCVVCGQLTNEASR